MSMLLRSSRWHVSQILPSLGLGSIRLHRVAVNVILRSAPLKRIVVLAYQCQSSHLGDVPVPHSNLTLTEFTLISVTLTLSLTL